MQRKRRAMPSLAAVSNESTNKTKRALRGVSARIIGGQPVEKALTVEQGAQPTESKVTGEDPFASFAQQGRTVEAPFDMLTLATLPEQSTELYQTLEAMEMNIEATGHRFVARLEVDDDGAKVKAEVQRENVFLQNFFTYATRETYIEFRKRLRKDKESTGNCYYEVLRNSKGNIQGFTHAPSYQVRLGRMEETAQLVDRQILKLQEDNSVKVETVKEFRRFRTYVQSRFISSRGLNSTTNGHRIRWFKEFGDPRNIDDRTGKVMKPAGKELFKDIVGVRKAVGAELSDEQKRHLANEMVHDRLYSPRSPYGLPRFIGNLLSIFGDRAAEEINFTTFKNNNIPSMAVLVSNGQLTQGTVERIESFVESQIQGSDNYSKFLIMEGEPLEDEGEDGGQYKIEIQPLTNTQHKDAMFQKYSEGNQDKIRRAYRLPPIFVGRSDDYTRGTAESSRKLADEQIFAPERLLFDEWINRNLFPEMGIVYHKFKSNSPNTTDNTQLVKILAGAEKTGGMTPRIARTLLEDILGQALPGFKKVPDTVPEGETKFDPDLPFSLTMAEAVKNEAPEPAEPGQSVTAVKNTDVVGTLKALGVLGVPDQTDDEGDEIVAAAAQVLKAHKRVEALWKARTED